MQNFPNNTKHILNKATLDILYSRETIENITLYFYILEFVTIGRVFVIRSKWKLLFAFSVVVG